MNTPIVSLIIFLSQLLYVIDGLDGCSKSSVLPQNTTVYVTDFKQKYTTVIKLTNLQEKVCMFSENFKTNITVRLVDQYYTYATRTLQYHIPRTLGIECPVKQESGDCQTHCGTSEKELNSFKKCDYKPPPDTIRDSGIYRERVCNPSPLGKCNVWYVNVYSTAPPGSDSYSVYKCSGSKQISVVELVIYQESKPPFNQSLEFDTQEKEKKVQNDGGVFLMFKPISEERSRKDFGEKCFLEDEKGEYAVVDKCNDDYTEIPGEVGEIKCNDGNMSNYCSDCTFAPSLFKVDRDDATSLLELKSFCEMKRLDFQGSFEKYKLPKSFDDYRIEQRPNSKHEHFQAVYNEVYLSLDMVAELPYTPYTPPDKCSLRVPDSLDLTGYIDTKGASFSVSATANKPINIITECEEKIRVPSVMTNQTTDFTPYTIYFNPDYPFVDTSCNISCGDDRKRIRLTGTFVDRQLTVRDIEVTVSDYNSTMIAVWDAAKILGLKVIDQVNLALQSLEEGIAAYSSDPTVIIAAIVMILFTVYAVVHCCFPCVKSPFVLVYKALSCCCGSANLSTTRKKIKLVDEV